MRPKFSFSSQIGVANASETLKLMNREQFISFVSKTFEPNQWEPTWEDKMNRISPNWVKGNDSDWQGEIFSSSLWHSNSLAARGGSKTISFYSSLNWSEQDGPVIGNNSGNLSGRLNLSFTPFAWLKFEGGLAPSNSKISRVLNGGFFSCPMGASIIIPTEPIYQDNGINYNNSLGFQPFGLGSLNKSTLNTLPFYSSVSISLAKTFTLNALFSGEESKLLYNNFYDYESVFESKERRMVLGQDYNFTYQQSFGDLLEINAKAGGKYQHFNFDNNYFGSTGAGINNHKIRSLGVYLNSSISFANKLFVKGILGNEYSSKNTDANGKKPMLNIFSSVQYILINDELLENNSNWFKFLAISASYSYAKRGLPIYPIDILLPIEFELETTNHFDIGIDYALLDQRVKGEITYFRKTIGNMFAAIPVPFSNYMIDNDGNLRNTGIEFSLNSRNIEGLFIWKSAFNITYLNSKITDFSRNWITAYSGRFKGEAFDAFYLYNYKGVSQATGSPLFESNTQEEDFFSHSESKQIIAGNAQPKFYGGITNWFAYGRFDINIFFQFVYGNQIYDKGLETLTTYPYLWNKTQEYFENVWISPGDKASYPKFGTIFPPSTIHLFDASYIRLKDISIGYNIPKTLINKYKISSARIYVSGSNLFTISKYNGWNVDIYRIAFFDAPISRFYSLGIRIEL